jgi:hypothetical protein
MVSGDAGAAEPQPTIHEAYRAAGPSGAVVWGNELTIEQAVDRRKAGQDIVVRGDDRKANSRLAEQIERAVGPGAFREPPHKAKAGKAALPHWQHDPDVLAGHSFYETGNRKARRER